jgi:hypothetical protein
VTKSNFRNVLKEDDRQLKMTSNGIQIAKVKYPSNYWLEPTNIFKISTGKYFINYWLDLPQILNLGLCDQSKLYKSLKTTSKRRQPQITITANI